MCRTRKRGTFLAKVEEIHRCFAECDARGKFVRGGLHTEERDIKSIELPYRFDGETLQVDFPAATYGDWTQAAHTQTSKFFGYDYSVRGDDNQLRLVSEAQCKEVK